MRTSSLFIAVASVALVAGTVGCTKNVPQASNSGKDHRYKGAKTIELEGGEARVRDIVTYPGGDRVDWKVFELPEGSQGDMRVKLKWRPARPGMDLAFNVYDQWFHRIGRAKPLKSGSRRTKSVKIRNLKPGKYYIQIYASTRMDAGRYTLSLRFKERKPTKVPTLAELAGQIEDPPALPSIIEPKVKTPEEIAAEQEAQAKADEEARLAKEKADADAATQAELMKPVYGRIRKTQKSSGGVIITINVGQNKNVDKSWVGVLLQGRSDEPLPNSQFKIIKVTQNESIAKVKLSLDQVKANKRVQLTRDL